MGLAMTVGATKIRIQQENALEAMQEGDALKEDETVAPEKACST